MSTTLKVGGLALACWCVSVSVIAACSDDDPAVVASDAGTDAPVNMPDGGPGACAARAPITRTCTATKCTADLGEPAVCVDDKCVKVKSPECQTVLGPIDNDDAILVGQLIAQRGSDAAQGTTRTRSLQLGLDEINKETGGIYTADGCDRRPLALVVCDDSNAQLAEPGSGIDAGLGDRRSAATHLAVDLKVPAIFGPNNSNNTIEIATNVTLAAKTVLIPPTAGAAEITTIAGGTVDGVRLVWRAVPSDALQAKAIARIGEQTETQLKVTIPRALRIAIINRDDAFGRGLRDGVKSDATHNGTTWALNGANVADFSYSPIGDKATVAAAVGVATTAMREFQPDLVYFFGLGEIFEPMFVAYEDVAGANKPIWITSNSGQRKDLLDALDKRPGGLRLRVRGASSTLLTPLAQQFFSIGFKTAYPETKELSFGMTQSYDSAYMVAFAMTATKPNLDTQIKSIDVARELAKLVGGTETIPVGPSKLKPGLESMRKGEPINFEGASGPLEFDPTVGEAPGDYAVWCVRIDPNDNKSVYENATGQKYNYLTNALEGTFTCP